jgi:hypothetical protein
MKAGQPDAQEPGTFRAGWAAALISALAVVMALGNVSCTCGRVYCWDSATITVRGAQGESLLVATSLDLDGTRIDCPAPIVDSMGGVSTAQPCHEKVDVRASGSALIIEVKEAAPRRIGVVLRDGNAVLAERTFSPRYEKHMPNGDFCEPTCRQWQETWMLP